VPRLTKDTVRQIIPDMYWVLDMNTNFGVTINITETITKEKKLDIYEQFNMLNFSLLGCDAV
jgi:hypothetical protein